MIGFQSGRLQFTDLTSYPTLVEQDVQRPLEQRWMDRRALGDNHARLVVTATAVSSSGV